MSLYVFEVQEGELIASITEQAAAAGIKNAAIVSLIGAADEFTISTMPKGDPSSDEVATYTNLPAEMHGTGEIVDGKVHIHATMAVQDMVGMAGHLHAATIGHWFARAYVTPVD